MARGAGRRRRTTGAQVPFLEGAPAPCHPALRFSGIIRQLLRMRVPHATFNLGPIGLADPTIDARRVPKGSGYGRRLRLIVGIDLTRGGVDLECFERACARSNLFCAYHFGLTGDADCGPILKMRRLALETPFLPDLKRCSDTRAVRWSVLPNAIVDAIPARVENHLARTLNAPR